MTEKWVVVDVETTGLGKNDAIIEIAVIQMDGEVIVNEWETLVNPLRDVSNSNIHGITASHLSTAPSFSEISQDLLFLLQNRILVAHNIVFDKRMLKSDFARLGLNPDLGHGFCTYLATRLPLSRACAEFGIVNRNAHAAIDDALATAELLTKLDKRVENLRPVKVEMHVTRSAPRLISRKAFPEFHSKTTSSKPLLLKSLPLDGLSAELAYLEKLSQYLSDLSISKQESAALEEWANYLEINEERRAQIHSLYVDRIIEAAHRDGKFAEAEHQLVTKVAKILSVSPDKVPSFETREKFKFADGARICFTGLARDSQGKEIPREKLHELAAERKLTPVNSLTKKCDVLVAADINSMSSKTKQARDWNIEVIAVEDFLKWAKESV